MYVEIFLKQLNPCVIIRFILYPCNDYVCIHAIITSNNHVLCSLACLLRQTWCYIHPHTNLYKVDRMVYPCMNLLISSRQNGFTRLNETIKEIFVF